MRTKTLTSVGFIIAVASFALAISQALQSIPDAIVIRMTLTGMVVILLAILLLILGS